MSNIWKPNKTANYWTTYRQPELYHYGVKGMRWKHHKGLQIEAQEATISGGQLPPPGTEHVPQAVDDDAAVRAYAKWQESQKPAWQKKWEASDVKKHVDAILSRIKSKMPKIRKPKKKKSNLKVTFSDGTSKDL